MLNHFSLLHGTLVLRFHRSLVSWSTSSTHPHRHPSFRHIDDLFPIYDLISCILKPSFIRSFSRESKIPNYNIGICRNSTYAKRKRCEKILFIGMINVLKSLENNYLMPYEEFKWDIGGSVGRRAGGMCLQLGTGSNILGTNSLSLSPFEQIS